MFSQASVCPSPEGGGVATPNASGQLIPPPPEMDMGPGHKAPSPHRT